MSLKDCLTKAGYTAQEASVLLQRATSLQSENESQSDAMNRLIPLLEEELNSDLLSIKNQLGIKETIDAPLINEFRSAETLPQALQKDNYAIISATQESQGAHGSDANVKANENLRKELIDEFGADNVQRVDGIYKGTDQGPSYIVSGIVESRAREIGSKYNQESIITNKGNVFSDTGAYNPNKGNVLIGETAASADFQSLIQDPDGNIIPFTMDIDWDQTIEPDVTSGPVTVEQRRTQGNENLSAQTSEFFSSFGDIIDPSLQEVQEVIESNPTEDELLKVRNAMMENADKSVREAGTRLPIKSPEFVTDVTEEDVAIEREFNRHKSSFGLHIEASIPTFKDSQIKKAKALSKTVKDGDVVYDLGGSEGSFIKSAATNTEANAEFINLDSSKSMEKTFNKTPVEGTRFVAEAFGEGFKDGNVTYKRHVPKKKADIVHESMLFQFISPDRKTHIKEIKDNYIKDDGLLIVEEKVFNENWEANENKKNEDWKSQHFSKEDIALKEAQIGVTGNKIVESVDSTGNIVQTPEKIEGMNSGVVSDNELVDALTDSFEHVAEYWDAGNFKGYMASNDKAKIDSFIKEMGGPITSEFSNPTPDVDGKSLGTRMSEVTGDMAKEFDKLQTAINTAVDNAALGTRGGERSKISRSLDNNKFIQEFEDFGGNDAGAKAKHLGDVLAKNPRVPKSIRNELELELGEPFGDFVKRVREMNALRKDLGRRLLSENKKPKTDGVLKTQKAKRGKSKTKSKSVPKRGPGQGSQNSEAVNQSSFLGTNEVVRDIRSNLFGRNQPVMPLANKTTVAAVIGEAVRDHITSDGSFSKEGEIALAVINGEKIPTASEEVALAYATMRLQEIRLNNIEAYNVAKKNKSPDAGKYLENVRNSENRLDGFAQAIEIAGSKAGLSLRIRKEILTFDQFSESGILKMANRVLPQGFSLSAANKRTFAEQAKKIWDLRKEVNALYDQLRQKGGEAKTSIAQAEVKNLVDRKGKKTTKGPRRAKSLESARKKLDNVLKGDIC